MEEQVVFLNSSEPISIISFNKNPNPVKVIIDKKTITIESRLGKPIVYDILNKKEYYPIDEDTCFMDYLRDEENKVIEFECEWHDDTIEE